MDTMMGDPVLPVSIRLVRLQWEVVVVHRGAAECFYFPIYEFDALRSFICELEKVMQADELAVSVWSDAIATGEATASPPPAAALPRAELFFRFPVAEADDQPYAEGSRARFPRCRKHGLRGETQ